MALINIEYGSIASSDTMNKNFAYLEDKITEVSASTNTMISSILSNIATINSRLGDITDNVQDDAKSFEAKLEEYRNKSRLCLNKLSMLPNWDKCFSLTEAEQSSYKVPKNGYLLLNPKTDSKGILTVNGSEVTLKTRYSGYDNSAQLYFIPVKTGDTASCTLTLEGAYFLPALEISSEEL
ncbi:MAG: hypothetical protein NC408_08760 [Candidatus Gastranaerophilales bacterium]|nr:hypothetical protein [Candidatus Gastranaerophilales bacterium]MCM1073452.1 hypothetical protein [Bacteroides sp.]